ncbi:MULTISPECIES: glycoside hydrolase family 32 protein [unclassified Streptomyces]|uniref:glycoside hydrolase family 32 protein n=1 Tax=unclassified Streptomyces TaxID=2593676 RepID=UPI0038169C0B
MRARAGALVVALLAGLLVLLPSGTASAGTAPDYPEFPYPQTTYSEPQRGQFHFSSRSGWMNDPNGLVFANGEYHFFYQHNPHGLEWDTMHWGHATSPDLVHWTQKPIALEPGVHPGTLFSGAGVVDRNNTSGLKTGAYDPIVVFSNTDGVNVHYSNDNGRTFQSWDKGREVIDIPEESRDPKVFWDQARGRWTLVVWSNRQGNGVYFYTSPNLRDWTYASRYQASWLFECPDMFPLQLAGRQRWVLTDASGEYVVGDFDGTSFRTDWTAPQRMDFGATGAGGDFYAAQVFNDAPGGRVVQMAWQGGNRGSVWTGNASFPAELALVKTPDGPRITRTPVPELDSLAAGGRTVRDKVIGPATADPFARVKADTYRLTATFDVSGATARRFGFGLHTRADGSADHTVVYDTAAQTLDGKPLAPRGGKIALDILVDRGQLEIFADGGRFSYTRNVDFDSGADSLGLRTFAEGGTVTLHKAELTQLSTSWGRGEPTLESNLAGPWRAARGSWSDVSGGKRGSASGDGFYLSNRRGADAVYQGDITLDSARAGGLTFRADTGGAGYTATLDTGGTLKLWRPGRDIAVVGAPVGPGETHHLKVRTDGPRIRVWLDHGAQPLIDATDDTYAEGLFGANVYAGAATVQNLHVGETEFAGFTAGRWNSRGGTWTSTPEGLRGRARGDAFYLSDRTGGDFDYEGDLTVTNGAATGLTFRADATGAGYTATLDTSGVLKLWRPGRDIAVHRTPVTEGRSYHVKVRAEGPRIRVWLGGAADPVIDATDPTYGSGFFGVNAFDGNVLATNLRIS